MLFTVRSWETTHTEHKCNLSLKKKKNKHTHRTIHKDQLRSCREYWCAVNWKNLISYVFILLCTFGCIPHVLWALCYFNIVSGIRILYKYYSASHQGGHKSSQVIDVNLDTFKTKCCKNSKAPDKLVWLSQNIFYWKIWVVYFLRTALAKIAVQWHEDKAVKEVVCDQL